MDIMSEGMMERWKESIAEARYKLLGEAHSELHRDEMYAVVE